MTPPSIEIDVWWIEKPALQVGSFPTRRAGRRSRDLQRDFCTTRRRFQSMAASSYQPFLQPITNGLVRILAVPYPLDRAGQFTYPSLLTPTTPRV
jgi:hypothetical protein